METVVRHAHVRKSRLC
ncbi:hypothetical protein F383_13723 [Gossypium arboreum]|uniref:Uncharacterized protein n=1 Tax=Gossypium arboreum TaxID=29729 RepID=A0A0B0Q0Q5_GOSAR|nr:hypothetical protein F383_13723 [Gossypium arboreum]